jgi:hypothetical protein
MNAADCRGDIKSRAMKAADKTPDIRSFLLIYIASSSKRWIK